jgi:hypothetical protein
MDSSSSGFFCFRAESSKHRHQEPSKDNSTAMLKFFSSHKKYQHQEPLKDLGIPDMTVEEFWEDGDKDYNEFEYGKLLVTKQVHANLMWPLRRLHEWYYFACVCGLQFIKGHIFEAVFKSRSFDLNIEMLDLHTIYRLRMLDITMMTIFCTKCFKYLIISSVINNVLRNLMTRFSCAV